LFAVAHGSYPAREVSGFKFLVSSLPIGFRSQEKSGTDGDLRMDTGAQADRQKRFLDRLFQRT
jgi:hypothetical protein